MEKFEENAYEKGSCVCGYERGAMKRNEERAAPSADL